MTKDQKIIQRITFAAMLSIAILVLSWAALVVYPPQDEGIGWLIIPALSICGMLLVYVWALGVVDETDDWHYDESH